MLYHCMISLEEVEYQHIKIDLMVDMETRTETLDSFEDNVSILPLPFTNRYMFSNIDGREEDVALETDYGA